MRKILTLVVAVCMGLALVLTSSAPVSATESCDCGDGKKGVPTAILGKNGCSCDDGKGSSIMDVLNLVVDIMSVGVGILGVIGITLVGIQYLTAGGSEEKVKKSKRRMFEIVIGIVVYAVLYAWLKWLLPKFTGTDATNNTQQTTTSQQEGWTEAQCRNAGLKWENGKCTTP